MKHKDNAILTAEEANGTSVRTFRVTGIGEYWRIEESHEGDEEIFAKEKFEEALKKVSRKVKKQLC